MADLYPNYAALAAAKVEGTDYRIYSRAGTGLAHIAIHGGGIEVGTLEAADALTTGRPYAYYAFDGRQLANNSELHITSVNFDEPIARALVATVDRVVSWHGAADETPGVAETWIGGRDTELRNAILARLSAAGFAVTYADPEVYPEIAGVNPRNIANRCRSGRGVQLELSTQQRRDFFPGGDWSRSVRESGARTAAFTAYMAAVEAGVLDVTAHPAERFGVVEADLTGDLPQAWRVTVAGPTEQVFEGRDSGLESVTVTFDASRAPRVDATVVVAVDPEVADQLTPDPGSPRIVTIAAGYDTGPMVTMAELYLDTADYEAGRLTLRAFSAERKVLESAELLATHVPPARIEASDLLAHLLDIGGSWVLLNNPEGLTGQLLTLEAVDNVWDALASVAAGEGWRLYSPQRDSGEGTLEIRRTPTGNEPAMVTLRTGPSGTVTHVAKSTSRDLYATEVAVIHEWTTPEGRDRRVQAVARAPIAGIDNVRRAVFRYRTAATGTQTIGAAQAYLHRALAKLTAHDVSAVNAFWLRPDMVVELEDTTGATVNQLVDRVTFTSAGVMDLTTRGVPVWWSIGDAAVAYPSIAAHRAAFATIGAAAQGPNT